MVHNTMTARVGVIGLGGRGMVHADHVRELGHEVAGGVDIDPEARERFADKYDAPVYESYEELYEEGLDAVEIVTPNKFHEPAAVAAFEEGLSVLIEKPLAHSLESAERIAAAARAADGVGMVGFNDRFRIVAGILKSHIDDGRLGDVTYVKANKIRRRGMPTPGTWFTNKEIAGGGALIDIGGHALHLALSFMDFPDIAEVSGVTRSEFGMREEYADPDGWHAHWEAESATFDVEDSASAFLRCADGRALALDTSWAMNRETKREFVVCGTEAGARIRGNTLTFFETGTEISDHYIDTEIKKEGDVWLTVEKAFMDSVVTGQPPSHNTIEEALFVQRVIDAVYRSDERGTGEPIKYGTEA